MAKNAETHFFNQHITLINHHLHAVERNLQSWPGINAASAMSGLQGLADRITELQAMVVAGPTTQDNVVNIDGT